MSVIIAIKDKDKVVIGADSQCTCGDTRTTLSNYNNYKIWKTRGLPNSIMGHTGYVRDVGTIRFNNFIPETRRLLEDIDYEFVQTEFIWDIYDALDSKGLILNKSEGPRMCSSFLFTYKDSIYRIDRDMVVIDVSDYMAMGSGESLAMGSLNDTIGQDPVVRILKAIKAAQTYDLCVGFPVIISDTESTEMVVYTEEDMNKLLDGVE